MYVCHNSNSVLQLHTDYIVQEQHLHPSASEALINREQLGLKSSGSAIHSHNKPVEMYDTFTYIRMKEFSIKFRMGLLYLLRRSLRQIIFLPVI